MSNPGLLHLSCVSKPLLLNSTPFRSRGLLFFFSHGPFINLFTSCPVFLYCSCLNHRYFLPHYLPYFHDDHKERISKIFVVYVRLFVSSQLFFFARQERVISSSGFRNLTRRKNFYIPFLFFASSLTLHPFPDPTQGLHNSGKEVSAKSRLQ